MPDTKSRFGEGLVTSGGQGKEKPVGDGKKELAGPLAFCSSVGGRALTSLCHSHCSCALVPQNKMYRREARIRSAKLPVNICRMLVRLLLIGPVYGLS